MASRWSEPTAVPERQAGISECNLCVRTWILVAPKAASNHRLRVDFTNQPAYTARTMIEAVSKPDNNQAPALVQFLKSRLQTLKYLKEGEVVEATLLEKTPRAAYLDLGRFGTGIVYGFELGNAKSILKAAAVGDRLSAKVVCLENAEGFVELSLAEAGRQRLWQKIKDLQDEGAIVKLKVSGANTGGLVADLFELKAFLPVSQLAVDHYPKVEDGDKGRIVEELKKFIGQELNVKVIDINPRLNKLIVSERETLVANLKDLVAKYALGQTVQVLVVSLANFGVFVRFVDNPQIEGLIHASELSHQLFVNPKEVIKVNEVISAKIIEIKDDRIFLSLKALEPDPWIGLESRYRPEQEVRGLVAQFNPFGAVINLSDGLQGLIHVSEFGSLEEMKKILTPEVNHTFIIDSLRPEEKRITLKLKH